jgi:class 3 adenylate cyclase/CHASE2 domain-containing sensor protein
LLVSQFFVLHTLHFETRYETGREPWWWLPFWQQLERAELSLYDARFSARGPKVPNSLDQIAIVGIDQSSLTVFEQWPIPRDWHARLIRRLKSAGAKVIVLDIDFSDKRDIHEDAELARALAEAGNVVLPSYDARQIDRQGDGRTMEFLTTPLGTTDYDEWYQLAKEERKNDSKTEKSYQLFQEHGLDEQTPDISIATLHYDFDGNPRRYPFRVEYHDGSVRLGGLAVLAVGMHQGLLDSRENAAYELALQSGLFPRENGAAVNVPLNLNLPAFRNSPIHYTTPINFWGRPGTFTTYSYKDVLGHKSIGTNGKSQFRGFNAQQLKKRFKDKIVFVGATAHVLKDTFPLPYFDMGREEQDTESEISGVEIHATVAAMLLDGEYIRTTKPRTTMLLVYVLSVMSALWAAVLRGWVNKLAALAQARASKIGLRISFHSLIWFLLYCCFAIPPIVGFWEIIKLLFVEENLWVVAVYPLAGALVSSALVLMMLFGVENVERRKTISQLGAYVAPEVRDEILAQAEGEYVRPRRVHATMLFTDLEGFTSYSETHEPEQVVEALNDYFDRMVRIIRAHGGGTDKFIGDAVMAFFGVPVPRYDHAVQAVLCAIAMQEECARFRDDTGIDFFMRIGIHSGEMIAGSIGATQAGFLNYTTIGDTVNLASRLEGKNKEFGSWIMCSAETFEAARSLVEGESARANIKGKAKDVEVYVVHGLKGHPEQSNHWGHQLPAAPGAALPHEKPRDSFGDSQEPLALPAPVEVNEGKSL